MITEAQSDARSGETGASRIAACGAGQASSSPAKGPWVPPVAVRTSAPAPATIRSDSTLVSRATGTPVASACPRALMPGTPTYLVSAGARSTLPSARSETMRGSQTATWPLSRRGLTIASNRALRTVKYCAP